MNNKSENLPLVSIVVPVFNGEQYLQQSLDSIVNQSYPRIEILVMDDASTDNTEAIVASYAKPVQYHRQSSNRGIYGNMNDGIEKAQGDYIAFYHADDIYDPRIVEREVAFFQQYPEAGSVFTESIFIDGNGRKFGEFKVQPELRGSRPFDNRVIFNALLSYKNRFLICPCNMTPTRVYRDVGLYRDKEFLNSSDLEMWLRIARKYPIGVIEESLIKYRNGHNSSAKRYHHLRTTPDRYFMMMDLYLEGGGHEVATSAALAAYGAHREEDRLMRAINHYILDKRKESHQMLNQVMLGHLLASSKVQRLRLLALFLAMKFLSCLPRISFVADFFLRRWHQKNAAAPIATAEG